MHTSNPSLLKLPPILSILPLWVITEHQAMSFYPSNTDSLFYQDPYCYLISNSQEEFALCNLETCVCVQLFTLAYYNQCRFL